MDDKVPEHHESADALPNGVTCEALAPGKVANFPGSLVANQIQHAVKTSSYPQDKRKLANWVAYFREGWNDPGIWKSAVSNCLWRFHHYCSFPATSL